MKNLLFLFTLLTLVPLSSAGIFDDIRNIFDVSPTLAPQRDLEVQNGIWISQEEILNLPMSGAAWDNMKSEADRERCTPDLSNQNDNCNVRVMAKALVFARTGDERYRQDVHNIYIDIIYRRY